GPPVDHRGAGVDLARRRTGAHSPVDHLPGDLVIRYPVRTDPAGPDRGRPSVDDVRADSFPDSGAGVAEHRGDHGPECDLDRAHPGVDLSSGSMITNSSRCER